MCVSAPESSAPDAGAPGITLASCPADIVELAAFREGARDLERIAAGQNVTLPAPGGLLADSGSLALCVRPERWLIVAPPASPGDSVARWAEASHDRGAVVDLSSALVAFLIEGPAADEMLTRACRLDLDAGAFPVGRAAATIMVQVPAILARLTPGMLLLTPATTAQHLREWLVEASRPFGLAQVTDAAVSELCEESST
jgi:heterotetrameric sarcosine oxidase gamma subunit